MKAEEVYVRQVLHHILSGPVRDQIEAELCGHIADRVERGGSVEDAIRQLGDPRALAESYLAAVPMRKPPHFRRGLAKIIDLVLVSVLPGIVFVAWLHPFAPFVPSGFWRGREFWYPIAFTTVYLAAFGLSCWYPILMEYFSGQTLGKRLFGLQVVTEKGARIGLGQAIVRQLPIFLQVLLIDALFVLFTDRRQRAFEMLSKTRVVDVSEAAEPAGTMATAVV